MMDAALKTSCRSDWCTPPCVLNRVRAVGEIILDPCSNKWSQVGAQFSYNGCNENQDGLLHRWYDSPNLGTSIPGEEGLVFVNPPYGKRKKGEGPAKIALWAEKIAREARRGIQIIALVPARTETEWFQLMWMADALCFWRGRLKFLLEGKTSYSAPFPSVLPYWGPNVGRFVSAFSSVGQIVIPRLPRRGRE